MLNWLKKIYTKFKWIKPMVGDVGLVNVKPEFNTDIKGELKFADKQENKFVEVNNTQQNQTFYLGMSYTEVKNVVDTELALSNQRLMEILKPRLLPENIDKIKNDFDFLDTYREAVKISAKKQDDITDKVLSEIILERVKEENDFPKIVQNESIYTIGKLTKSQINILHTLAMCHSTTLSYTDYDDLIIALNELVKPLFDCNFVNIDFNYLVYTGCIDQLHTGYYEFNRIIERMAGNKYNLDSYKNSEDYKYMEQKWNNSLLNKSNLTTVGQYIGLHYHNVMFDKKLPNLNKLFISEDK